MFALFAPGLTVEFVGRCQAETSRFIRRYRVLSVRAPDDTGFGLACGEVINGAAVVAVHFSNP
jgi:hypothetical protein